MEHESILASAQDTGQFQQPKSDEPISEETREISNERRNSEQYASDRDKAKEKAASAVSSDPCPSAEILQSPVTEFLPGLFCPALHCHYLIILSACTLTRS